MEFKPFSKIENLHKVLMSISQKLHGTNAFVYVLPTDEDGEFPAGSAIHVDEIVEINGIERYAVRAGSRTRWIYPGDDNYGFAGFVRQHKAEFAKLLGPGQHFGEYCGPGINSGEGLTEKTFVLFDWWKYPEGTPLPPQTAVVPMLYQGTFDLDKIEKVMAKLKANGSSLAPGFMYPEGIVIQVLGQRIKKVFDAEEVQWKPPAKVKAEKVAGPDVSHLLQPLRLEKLLSKDERYVRAFPKSLPEICSAYVADLIEEKQIVGDEDQIKAIRKALGSDLFVFVKHGVAALYGGMI